MHSGHDRGFRFCLSEKLSMPDSARLHRHKHRGSPMVHQQKQRIFTGTTNCVLQVGHSTDWLLIHLFNHVTLLNSSVGGRSGRINVDDNQSLDVETYP